jgi:hypothetical protein
LWIENTEGAKFWMKVFNDLKTRCVADILTAVTYGLEGIPEALSSVFSATTLQTCIVHLIRNSLDYASWKERRPLAAALKPAYRVLNADAAAAAVNELEQGPWGQRFPTVVAKGLGPSDTVLCVPTGGAPGDSHNQRHREPTQPVAHDHQDRWTLSQRRCGDQADVAGVAQNHSRLGPRSPGMARSDESICNTLRQEIHVTGTGWSTRGKHESHGRRLLRPGKGLKPIKKSIH